MNPLAVHDVSVSKNKRHLLRDISLELSAGSVVGLIGPNGAGKSTLLRVMAGLQPTASGHVELFGENVQRIAPQTLGQQLAYLPQDADCAWPLAVEKIVALGRIPHSPRRARLSETDITVIDRVMCETDIQHLTGRTLNTLSGGEKMRVMMARALASEPQILLADEPIAALDPLHQFEVMNLLAKSAKNGATVVVVLHELNLAMRYCDRLVLLNEGRLLADGTPETVLSPTLLAQSYQIEAQFGQHDNQTWILPWRILDSEG